MVKKRKYPIPSVARFILKQMNIYNDKHSIVEDFNETFVETAETLGIRKAKLWYWKALFKTVPAYFKLVLSWWINIIFFHNVLIVFRNFKRNKSMFIINVIGLSTGLACALFIFLWVNDELNVDKFHEKDSQLYQVMQNFELANGTVTWDYTPALLATAMIEEMPEIESSVSVNNKYTTPGGVLSNKDKHIRGVGKYTSKEYFNIFSYPLIQGDSEQVLSDKHGILLSRNLAQKLFNTTENIIGKTLIGNSDLYDETFHVTGVFENPPTNSMDHFDFILHFDFLMEKEDWVNRWESDGAKTYLILKKGSNIGLLNNKIAGLLRSKTPTREPSTLFVQQYSKRYLYGLYENGVQVGGRISYVKLFSIVAIFILMIACINFMNLSTAQASIRIKEIGIKKTLGAPRKMLMVQYLEESMLMAFLSLLIANLLINLFLPQYNAITGKSLTLNYNLRLLLPMLGITLFTGFIAGSYPALYLSGFNPINVLKGKLKTSLSEVWIRKGLVILQFSLSALFIVGFLVIQQQINFTQSKNLGYNRENVIQFRWHSDLNRGIVAGLKEIPGVMNASYMSMDFIKSEDNQSGYSWQKQDSDKNYLFHSPRIGYDLIETLRIEMRAGRSFSRDYSTEASKIIINEAAVQMMGLSNPIGQTIEYGSDGDVRQIIGVVKDFHYGSIHEKIKPLIFRFRPYGETMVVRIMAGTETATIKKLKTYYNQFHLGDSFDFSFMDEDYQSLYESEMQVGALSKYFSGMAIILSCLGLFGLAAFTADKRRKEIGIRKVLGLSEFGVIYLLSSDFTKMVLLAIAIALPVSYLIIKNWLNGFAYKINLEPWYFIGTGLITLCIAWLTVSVQAVKAANLNPVDILKDG